MKVVTIVGARPQFIKAAPVSKRLRARNHQEILIHTGQHYDYTMSGVFFEELDLPEPDVWLGVGSGGHAYQTGHAMVRLEQHLLSDRPDTVLVYGDTNSTLAGALVACKLGIPLVHVEAGLRSFNRAMPEEHNRVLVDHCADILFCPTDLALDNLEREGITSGVYKVGDTMLDSVLQFAGIANRRSNVLARVGVQPGKYYLATVHRPSNTDDPARLATVIETLSRLDLPVVFPVHPRTRKHLPQLDGWISWQSNVLAIEPVSYLDMLVLEQNARAVLTDSGGVQKEAFFFGVPCATLRRETEWVETIELGWNVLVGDRLDDLHSILLGLTPPQDHPSIYGTGNAAGEIVDRLESLIGAPVAHLAPLAAGTALRS